MAGRKQIYILTAYEIINLKKNPASLACVAQSLHTVPNWDHTVPAPSDDPPRVAWRALEILVVFTTTSKREGTCPMKVKQSLAWNV